MTKVDFYILDDSQPLQRLRFACRLAEKAWQQGHNVYIHTADSSESQRMDELLWTFRDGSFVPHQVIDEQVPDAETPIHIGHGDHPHDHDTVLINLADSVPLFFSRFERLAEVIGGDEAHRALGRERFRFYKERGYPLDHHTIS